MTAQKWYDCRRTGMTNRGLHNKTTREPASWIESRGDEDAV